MTLAVLGLALAAAACSGRPSRGVLSPVAVTTQGTSQVAMLAVATRQRSATDPGAMFDGERSKAVSFAEISVSIPPDNARTIGQIQWPQSLPGDPRRDFVTTSAGFLDQKGFSAALTHQINRSGRTKVLVFVHGFNTRFDDAVYRLAQIAHDSKVTAIPILFTWPSRGDNRLRDYTYDRESANYSRDALEELLALLANQPNVSEITVLAHSMGNWVALEALRGRSIRAAAMAKRARPDKLQNILLVAPDVDVDVFRTQLARMGSTRPRILLFVSKDDKVLGLSRIVWGGMPRLGEVDPNQEPYHTEFAEHHIEVFDLTSLSSASQTNHDKAFEDITSVTAMLKRRFEQGQTLRDRDPGPVEQVGQLIAIER